MAARSAQPPRKNPAAQIPGRKRPRFRDGNERPIPTGHAAPTGTDQPPPAGENAPETRGDGSTPRNKIKIRARRATAGWGDGRDPAMAGSAPDPGAGGGHGWDLGGRGKGVERWGNFWRFEEGGGGARAAAGGEGRGGERAACTVALQGRCIRRPLGRWIRRWSCLPTGECFSDAETGRERFPDAAAETVRGAPLRQRPAGNQDRYGSASPSEDAAEIRKGHQREDRQGTASPSERFFPAVCHTGSLLLLHRG
nr:unnamed protein product [Digitaria exilis]